MSNEKDYLSEQPVEIFIKNITYLPFKDVMNVCQTGGKVRDYCVNPKYEIYWKVLIQNTFSKVYNYENKLGEIWKKFEMPIDTYNYLVYTNMVKTLDPITQLMIYHHQGDMEEFKNDKFTDLQRFLALFLLGKKNEMERYLPSNIYLPFIELLEGKKIEQDIINRMLVEMAKEGSVNGIEYFIKQGGDIHANDDFAMISAIPNGHLEIVKYLIEHGANIHTYGDYALISARRNGHLEIVKYLIEHGANIHAEPIFMQIMIML